MSLAVGPRTQQGHKLAMAVGVGGGVAAWPARRGRVSDAAEQRRRGPRDSALGTGVWKGWWLCRRGEAPALGKAVPEIIPSLDLPATPSLARMWVSFCGPCRGHRLPHTAALWLIYLFILVD